MANESAYQEFTGKSVEEALKGACEAFKVGIGDLVSRSLPQARAACLAWAPSLPASLLRQSARLAVPPRSVPASQAALHQHQRPFVKSVRRALHHETMHQ
jgi:hypothetical protein